VAIQQESLQKTELTLADVKKSRVDDIDGKGKVIAEPPQGGQLSLKVIEEQPTPFQMKIQQ
jgi:hypothetical protein